MKPTLLVFVTLLLCASTGCSRLRLVPAPDAKTWSSDAAFAQTDAEGLRLRVSIAEESPSPLRLLVELSNEGTEPVAVLPTQFHVTGSAVSKCALAEDPEQRLAAIEEELGELRWRPDVIGATLGLFALVATESVRSIAGETDEERKRRHEEEKAEREAKEEARVERIAELEAEQGVWQQALRKTTLSPGQTARGFLQFECKVQQGDVTLGFPSAQSPLPFRIIKK